MKLIDFHTYNVNQHDHVISVVNQYPKDFISQEKLTSVGIHPWYIDTETLDQELSIIRNIAAENGCIAIGEIGLDKQCEVSFNIQRSVFREQLILAEEFRKPVIIHCVSALQEVLEDTKRLISKDVPVIIHGFSKKIEMANQFIDHGFYLSFGSNLMSSPTLQHTFTNISRDRIFLETGSHDQPIEAVYEFAAQLLRVSVEDLVAQTTTNFNTVFNI